MANTLLSKLMLWIFFMFNSIPILSFSCLFHQKEALLQFKYSLTTIFNTSSTTSLQFDELDSWNSASDCCTWDHVTCDITNMAVTELELHNIVGYNPLPVLSDILTPLFHIRSLQILDLSWISLQGHIPGDGFGNLTRLVHLDMWHKNFSGSIPSQLFQLESLEYLDLSNNGLRGVLSTEVGWLRNLGTLFLEDNLLSGNIPKEIGKLVKLRKLYLSNNQFTGGIPSSIINLKELEYLDFYGNFLSMQIPPCIGSWLPNMQELDLSNNKFTGPIPSSIQNMSMLFSLRLQHNKLTGDIPTSLFNITTLELLYIGGEGSSLILNNKAKIVPRCSLQRLYMTRGEISGQIPEWISSMRSLYFLDLSTNQLEGKFPDMLIQKSIIRSIVLSDNNLTGSLPPSLFDNEYLEVLVLSRNNFSGELPNNIGNANEMKILMLSENNLYGKLPKSMSNMKWLQILDLSRNRFFGNSFPAFTDPVLDSHSVLPSYFDFSYNNFFGKIPTSFPTVTKILSLARNRFSSDLPSNLTNLVNLETLDLHDNDITGNFQNVLPQIQTLQVLNLRENSLEGFIPSRISNLSSLQILDLSRNNLTGSIPPEFANLERMVETPNTKYTPIDTLAGFYNDFHDEIEFHDLIVNWKNSFQGISSHSIGLYSFLDLSDNRISGEIPSSLGNLKGLKVLNISHNNISGHIPVYFGNLTHIESLDLSQNKIFGTIPQSLEKLDELSVFDVSNNRLTGKIPMSRHMSTMEKPEFYANNSGLCGMQINISCSANIPAPEENEDKKENLSWIIWEGSWFGFPVGFFSSILMWGYLLIFLQFFKFW